VTSIGLQLDREELLDNLRAVGQILAEQGKEATIYVIGGAAIALTLNNRRTTRDVDAIVKSNNQAFRAATAIVAQEKGLPPDWCLDDVTEFVSKDPIGQEVFIALPGLNVMVASPEHLLAMKVRAAVTRDVDDMADIVFIANHLGISDVESIAELTQKQFAGIYRDSIGYDEYLDVVQSAFLIADLERRKENTPQGNNTTFGPEQPGQRKSEIPTRITSPTPKPEDRSLQPKAKPKAAAPISSPSSQPYYGPGM